MTTAIERVRRLPFWRGAVEPQRLGGGITNLNFTVLDAGEKFVVRVGDDIPAHQVMRFNERAASEAAFRAGLSPEVVHAEPGILVLRFIEARALRPEDVRDPATLQRIVALIAQMHGQMQHHVRGPALVFWVFHVVRDYSHTLRAGGSAHVPKLPRLLEAAEQLEREIGPVSLAYCHNDLLAGNLLDDGSRLWLIDWDYAGFNSPLFDLANLASNNELTPDAEDWLLAAYFVGGMAAGLKRRYLAMKCASLLRETLWSMVSEITSELDFDYAGYTKDYLGRLEQALADLRNR